jgi:PleD family two-component response regulator
MRITAVILAVVDDLMFTSKIRTTAAQVGVQVAFARSQSSALDQMRLAPPSLVIFDLNNPRIDALAIVASMKADPSLAAVPTVGYASHVQVDTIDAAKRAGVAEVLARSTFTQRLSDILARG